MRRQGGHSRTAAWLPQGDVVVAYVDDDLLGLVPGDRPGVLLAVRAQEGVTGGSGRPSAVMLAALRVVVEEVRSLYGVTHARIEPATHVPSAGGHLCYHVRPVFGLVRGKVPGPAARAERLADSLCRHAASRSGRVSTGRSAAHPPV